MTSLYCPLCIGSIARTLNKLVLIQEFSENKTSVWVQTQKHIFCSTCLSFLAFYVFFGEKRKKSCFDPSLECTAPKR